MKLSSVVSAAAVAQPDWSQYVNPLIGGSGPDRTLAYGGGDIFVGGAVPFGVAKVGIDTYESDVIKSTLNGGWTPQGKVTAVSMIHVSGTGGSPKYGVVPQMPLTSVAAPVNVLDNTTYSQTRVGEDIAKVGYYKTVFENGVSIELSGSRHAGIMQYSYPQNAEKHVLVDLSHYLPAQAGSYSSQYWAGGEIKLNADRTGYSGYGSWGGGWNEAPPYTIYFCAEFDQPASEARLFTGRDTDPVARFHTFSPGPAPPANFTGQQSEQSGPLNDRIGGVFTWNGSSTDVKSRVGISFISVDKACGYKTKEITSWNINDTVTAAVKEWNKDVFSKIQVPLDAPSTNRTKLTLLYSSLYFMHLMPSDRTDENPLWSSPEPYWDDWYTMWDVFRCTVSLYHLIQPSYYESMIRSVIDVWRYEGYMPDGRTGNYNGLTQGGSDADNVLADAYVKGLRGAINWTDGYAAMVKDAEVQPYNTNSLTDPSASVKEGRGALYDWIPLGYVSSDRSTRSASRNVEYALNDFSLAQVAKGIAPQDVNKYLNRSAQWQNGWGHNVTHKGFTGFMAPRLADGTFDTEDYNPAACPDGCEWTSISYEATPFEYSFTVPHDMDTLIKFMGGSEAFENRLDYIFKPNTSETNLGENGAGITTIMNIGNEPDFLTPYLYHFIGKQYKSVQQSRALANQFFKDDLYGVPGNSDSGALNSWLIWQMLGLYPKVTEPVYLIGSPWFDSINVTVNGNKTLQIKTTGLKEDSYYVQSVKVNGKVTDKNWLEHGDLMVNGGLLEFEVGPTAKKWETGPLPPSPGHVELHT